MTRIENACPFGYAADQCCGCDRCQTPGWQWVRISDVMVEMLRGEGCGPVIIRVEPREGNEVELIATRAEPDAALRARVAALEAERHAEAVRVLEELHALVLGECPSLLNEDSGGDARLALRIETALRAEGEGGR